MHRMCAVVGPAARSPPIHANRTSQLLREIRFADSLEIR
jgi:hypothetical protein